MTRPSPVSAVGSGPPRAIVQGSHVPTLDLRPLGGMLYPWRRGMTTAEEVVVTETAAAVPPAGNIKPDRTDRVCPQLHPAQRGCCACKYRGFWRTLCCLTMGRVVARPAVDGGIRYSSVRQLFHAPAEPDALVRTPSIRAPSRIGSHLGDRSNSQQAMRYRFVTSQPPRRHGALMSHDQT